MAKNTNSVALSEIKKGDKLIWNWKGGTPVEVKTIKGNQVQVYYPVENGKSVATVYPSSLSRPAIPAVKIA